MTTTFYKLRHQSNNNLECYVGSTNDFMARKRAHRSVCHNPIRPEYNYKLYQYIRANGGYDQWIYEVLYQDEEMTKRDKLLKEGELTQEHRATLNIHKAGAMVEVGKEQYKRDHAHKLADTDNECERCGRMYRGKNAKRQHQRSKRCADLANSRRVVIENNAGGVINIHYNN